MTSFVTPHINRFSNFPTVRRWNDSIREAVSQGQPNRALLLLRQMKQNGFEPDNFTLLFTAKACSKLSSFLYSKTLHALVVKSQFGSDVFVLTAISDMYAKCNELCHAQMVFERIPVRDTAAWNSIIVGFSQLGLAIDRVLCLFRRMRLEGVRPDSVTFMGLARAASNSKNVGLLKAIHSIGIRTGFGGDVSVANTWISAYAKCNDQGSAKSVFDGIDSATRTLVSWNSAIEAYSELAKFLDALGCYKMMLRGRFRPDSGTIVSLLSSCQQPEALIQGGLVHCHAIELGCDLDISVVNTLISMYSKCGDVTSARRVFDTALYKTRVSWNVMISGYANENRDCLDKALGLFRAMESDGERPDSFTLVSLASGCGRAGELETGRWIDSYALSNGLRDDPMVCNALIDMYAKCGSTNEARGVFHMMPERDSVSWTAMITGCALNGEVAEALRLIFAMSGSGSEPNRVTFLAVLQACIHAGLLEKGIELFETMTDVYNITPELEHYSCLVDLFGRNGRIEEALEIVRRMPVKPDVGVWSSLLCSCKIHRNIEIAEHASRRIIELEPTLSIPYIEMASVYALDGKWDRVASTRKQMKGKNVKKVPGQSSVMVDGKCHVFTVEDWGHPEGSSICAMLNNLMSQLKDKTCLAQQEISLDHDIV